MSEKIVQEKKEKGNKRAPNYTAEEKSVLCAIVKKYQHIIESKKTDSVSSKEKDQAWQIVANEFNANATCKRTTSSIRERWTNLKKVVRNKTAVMKREAMATGGGAPHIIKYDELDNQLIEVMEGQMEGMQSQYDDDSSYPFVTPVEPLTRKDEPVTRKEQVNVPELVAVSVTPFKVIAPSTSQASSAQDAPSTSQASLVQDAPSTSQASSAQEVASLSPYKQPMRFDGRRVFRKSPVKKPRKRLQSDVHTDLIKMANDKGSLIQKQIECLISQENRLIQKHDAELANLKAENCRAQERHKEEMERLQQERRHASELHELVMVERRLKIDQMKMSQDFQINYEF